jgi:CubicO group peptidase (beta-lactamase class C family)
MKSTIRIHAFAAMCMLLSFSATMRPSLAGELSPAAGPPAQAPAFNFDRAVMAGASMPRLHSLLVSHRGERVLERYFNGYAPTDYENVKSVSKSIISALVGIAIEEGSIRGPEATLGEYFSGGASADKAGITIENLLTMQAGLRSTSNGNYGAWVRSANWIEFALEQPLEAPPGRRMQYSTGNTHLLSAVLTRATGRSTLEFAREELAEPLGFRLAPWPHDPQGIYFGGNDMELTPRQMLAFGELYLNGGRANGRQVVPAAWVEASLRPHTESPQGEDRYYGYGWWVCTLAGFEVPHAWGYGGQFIMLVPELELVIATTSSSSPGPESNAHANLVYQLLQQVILLASNAT